MASVPPPPPEPSTPQKKPTPALYRTSSVGSTAAAALSLLLREDPLLTRHGLIRASPGAAASTAVLAGTGTADADGAMGANEESAFSYAAALLHEDDQGTGSSGWMSSTGEVQRRAAEALAEVDRKLALVESLAERIGRERPEDVAGPLLRLHGYDISDERKKGEEDDDDEDDEDEDFDGAYGVQSQDPTSLVGIRDRCDRLRRQGEVLEGVAKRVETSLRRGLGRMESATSRLSRVLHLSATLKMCMRLTFEAKKVQGSGVDFEAIAAGASVAGGPNYSLDVDLRDLTRAAASVAVMEELLSHPDLRGGGGTVDVVEQMRPEAVAVASSVRRAAAALLAEQQRAGSSGSSPSRLGATLQVYFHLGELPDAAWGAVGAGLAAAEKASAAFFNPAAVQRIVDSAKAEAKAASSEGGEDAPSTSEGADRRQRKKQGEAAYDRSLKRRLREKRAEAAQKWARGLEDAALRTWTLQRVLARKSDPVTRRTFLDVVAESPVPIKFSQAEEALLTAAEDAQGGGSGIRRVKNFVFALFWKQMCLALGKRVQKLLRYQDGAIAEDVAALFPAIRAAAIDMLGGIQDSMQIGSLGGSAASSATGGPVGGTPDDFAGGGGGGADTAGSGIMGGSAGLDGAFSFFGQTTAFGEDIPGIDVLHNEDDDADVAAGRSVPADSWTQATDDRTGAATGEGEGNTSASAPPAASSSRVGATALAHIFSSHEWTALQGYIGSGLQPLQASFLEASSSRLVAPLKFMFPEAVALDENGDALPVLPQLPSRYDLAKLDTVMKEELSLADPREGGGDLNMTTMISSNVVDMVGRFCAAAAGATSESGEEGFLHEDDGSATEALLHDMKVAGVMSTLAISLRNVPENTFVAPYRPAHSSQQEEAANMCRAALNPALSEINNLVQSILSPLCRALNKRASNAIAKMHQGTYLEESVEDDMSDGGGFVQRHLGQVYEDISANLLSKLPAEYASVVASTVATYSIYAFVSNASLVRPLGERGRLRITQDLADFELCLEQLIFKGGSAASLNQMDGSRPYAELRAVRNMLFWTGLEDKLAGPTEVAKSMLREPWVRDVRPSTVFHFLFSFAPPLLSSPHHTKRISAEEYVGTLVKLDGGVDDGEASAWMTTMACCESYQQRESVDVVGGGGGLKGDRRIAPILMILGPELLRRRRL